MKRLLAALLLMVTPAFAQQSPQYDYTVTNPTFTGLEGINQTQGVPTNLGDDGTVTGINIGFDFDFYGEKFNLVNLSSNGLISFKNNINGCCSGELLPSNQYNDFGIFGIWTDLVNIGTINPYYKTLGEEGSRRFVVGWYDQAMFYDENQKSSFEITLFEGSNNILLSYGDINLNRDFTSGIQGYGSQGQFEQIYFGSDGNTLDNTSWLLTYSAVEPPPPPPPPEEPIAPDCTINPNDPTCIINALIPDPTDEEFLADTGFDSGSDDGSDAFAQTDNQDTQPAEEILAESVIDTPMDDPSEPDSLEEMLASDTVDDEEEASVETVVAAKTLENEEKAAVLSDSISRDVLEAALSVAADATSAGSVAGESTSTSSSSSSSSSRGSSEQQETMTAETTQSSSETSSEDFSVAANEGDASAELLETGRVMGQEALAATLAGTEASANESMAEAETITAMSAEASMVVENTDSSSIAIQTEEVTTSEEMQTQDMGIVVADTVEQSVIENVVAEATVQAEASTEMSFDVGKEMMAENAEQMAFAEAQESEALAIVAAAAASSEQTFEDDSAKDAEVTNALVDPAFAMANTFNQAPNMMSLEFLGVLQPIEKSDAEIRAEQVVAANKEQQDAINANYMDADQSGIVSAIAVDADVSSYLSQRLTDVPFYKPEDIYKNIVIKDNVRGSYFLEKGNTDTYKRMVEEQYDNE
ncbi:hypothetical protein OAU13_00600 [bacterium]|nr:hypothetical protein [bacterium]